MDGEFLSDSPSDDGPEGEEDSPPGKTYSEQFEAVFPYYLSLGMTYDQFWNDDPGLVRYYRKAEEIRNEKRNQEMWLQGMYFYDALCDAAPILRAFGKKGTKPLPYPKKPYPLKAETQRDAEVKEKGKMQKALALMEAFATKTNAKFTAKKEVIADGGQHD